MKSGSSQALSPKRIASAEPAELAALLQQSQGPMDLAAAQAVRDRAAALVMTDPGKARAIAKALMEAALRSRPSSPGVRAVAWRCRAEADLFSGRVQEAAHGYERASREARSAGMPGLLGQILVGRTHLLALLGESGKAGRLARQAEDLLEKAGDLVYLGKLHMNRGNAFYQRDQYSQALESYGRALEVFDRMGIRDATWVGLLMNQGIAFANLSRLPEADDRFQRVDRECRRLGLDALRAMAWSNRALLLALRGRYQEALQLLNQAAEQFRTQDIQDMAAAALRSRAEIYLDLGMPGEAAESAAAAVEVFQAQGLDLDAAIARTIQSRGLMESGRLREARELLEAARAFFRKKRNAPRLAAAGLRLARLSLAEDKPADARRLASASLKEIQGLGMVRTLSEARRVQAEALLRRGRPAEAAEILKPGLKQVRKLPIRERIEVWSLAGKTAYQQGDRAAALSHMDHAVEGVEAEWALIPGAEYRARAFEDRVRTYLQRIDLELDSPRIEPGRLFHLVEAARARGFHERRESKARQGGDARSEKQARLGSLVQRLSGAEFPESGQPDPRAVQSLQAEILKLESEIVEDLLRESAGRSGPAELDGSSAGGGAARGGFTTRAGSAAGGEAVAVKDGARAGRRARGLSTDLSGAMEPEADPDRISARLGRDEALVEYFLAGDRLIVFVLDRRRFELRVLPIPREALAAQIDRVRFQIDSMSLSGPGEGPDPQFVRRAAEHALQDLYRTLLEPIAHLLPEEGRLTIVPHHLLHAVPFECLHDGDGYLGRRFVIRRVPSGRHLLSRPARRRTGQALVSGLVKGGPAFVRREMEAVAGGLSGIEVETMPDPGAEDLLRAIPRARIVHLATHGFFREDNPLFSRLTTADGALFLADLLGRRLPADLVVLSACSSGQAFTGRGDDLAGVAHGFLSAGTRTLVAGMWRVHDRATCDLMSEFFRLYSGQAQGDAARALRDAGGLIRREWDHPFFWGGFSVHGG